MIETQGIIEQITVAIDLNLQPVNDLSAIKLVQAYKADKLTKEELYGKMFELAKESVLLDTGEKAFDFYKKQYDSIQKAVKDNKQ